MSKQMTRDEALRYIHQRREENKTDFKKIAQELKDLGYRGERSHKPITAPTVRFMFYHRKPTPGPVPPGPARSVRAIELPPASTTPGLNKLEMIRAILTLKTDDTNKVQLIEQIVSKN